MLLKITLNMSSVTMTNDGKYGNSHYRQFKTLSERLTVEHGTSQPARVRQQKGITAVPAANGGIAGNNTNRKDKWVRIAPSGKTSHPLIQGSEAQHGLAAEDVEQLGVLYDQGDLSYEQYIEAFYDLKDQFYDGEGNSAVIST